MKNYFELSCPIIFLTARIEETDAIIGFQSGWDDYVIKPFRLGELGARVEAHLRRENRGDSTNKKEFDIVELLTRNPGQVSAEFFCFLPNYTKRLFSENEKHKTTKNG